MWYKIGHVVVIWSQGANNAGKLGRFCRSYCALHTGITLYAKAETLYKN